MNLIDRILGTLVGVAIGLADVARGAPPEPETLAPGTRVRAPRHPTHVWDDEPVYDRVPFPEAENPVEGVLTPAEWRELEHVALLDNLCHGRDV